MIHGETFLVLADEWGVYPTVGEHLLRPLVKDNRLLWVHMLGLRAPELSFYDVRRACDKISRWLTPKNGGSDTNGIALYSPALLPFPNRAARWWNRRLVVNGVRQRFERLSLRRPIVFATVPNAAEVLGAFDERLVVYLCEDEHIEWPGVYRQYAREMEERLLERADLTFATSRPLVESKSRPGRPAIYMPQGVDFEHFHHVVRHRPPVPDELRDLPPPRIGFAGLLNFRLDIDLLTEVARANPEGSVVLIGPERIDLRRLLREKNVFLLGRRAYAELPRYLAHFDVGLIPYRLNRATHYINPIKLLEYFAAGLPVVATALPDIVAYGELVYCARDADEFVRFVREAVEERSEARCCERIAAARENSWQHRAERLSGYLEQSLAP
jgi:glycosyltransferase involved in cell wall biosynthesis